MSRSIEALITPNLLVWGRESASLTIEQVSKRMSVDAERIQEWESGRLHPSMTQLREMAHLYRRPIAVFYLPDAPRDFSPLRDYRRMAGTPISPLSTSLVFEIREAQSRRETALELAKDLEILVPDVSLAASVDEDPEKVGSRLRDFVGARIDAQGRRQSSESFSYWRKLLEAQGILVFQTTEVTWEEARGFSLSESPYPVIAVNRKDHYNPRIFTLLHELTHVALRQGGVCDLAEQQGHRPEELHIEVFCNRVAGAVLIPKDTLLAHPLVAGNRRAPIWDEEDLKSIAYYFGGSREAVLRRLLIFKRTSKEFYERKRSQYQAEYARREPRAKGGFVPPANNLVSTAGKPFVRIVLEGLGRGEVTLSRALDYFGIRAKHLDKIRRLSIAG